MEKRLILSLVLYLVITVWAVLRCLYQAEWLLRLEDQALSLILGEKGKMRLQRFLVYACEEANPLVQIFYLVLMSLGYGLVIYDIYPRLPCGHLSERHEVYGMISFALCLATFVKASRAEAGRYYTEDQAKAIERYAYDNVLYLPRQCPSAKIRKIARSKYCHTSKCNIARYDHYCPWLNNPIGQYNYKWFFLFLVVHLVTLMYGTIATAMIIIHYIVSHNLLAATFIKVKTGQTEKASYRIVFSYLCASSHKIVIGLFMLCLGMGFVLFCFVLYHLYLIACNMTTNEYFKWRTVYRYCRKHKIQPPANIYNLGFFSNFSDMLFLSPQELRLLPSTAAAENRFDDTPEHRPLFYAIFASATQEDDGGTSASESASGSESAEEDKQDTDPSRPKKDDDATIGKVSKSDRVRPPKDERPSLRRRRIDAYFNSK